MRRTPAELDAFDEQVRRILADGRPRTSAEVVDAMGLPHGGPGQGGRGTGKPHGAHVLAALKRLERRGVFRKLPSVRAHEHTWQLSVAPAKDRRKKPATGRGIASGHVDNLPIAQSQKQSSSVTNPQKSPHLKTRETTAINELGFEVGRTYKRSKDIHARFGGQEQGGISTPTNISSVFLFTGKTGQKHGYSDSWTDDGVFRYVGEGQHGDMQFKGGNRAIRDHGENGKALYVFEAQGKGKGVVYLGEFVCSTWEYLTGEDTEGNKRKTIVFHLVPENALEASQLDNVAPLQLGLDQLRQRAINAASPAAECSEKLAKKTVYERSRAVRDYVLARANGVCESCNVAAPFARNDGSPYLEPHHTRRVSDGGPDDPHWVGAVCPNCHTEIHRGKNGTEKNRALEATIRKIESNNKTNRR